MKLFTKTRLIVLAGAAVVALPLSFLTFPGSPRWPLSGGFHYVADLNTVSFPAGSVWDNNAQWSLSDWRDMGGTSFTPGFRRANPDPNNHADGRSTWIWTNQPTQSWLGVTYVRWIGGTLIDCDIWYNSRVDYLWTTGLFDPCAYRSYWPVDFRNVARHETGHAIGFDHEDRTLCNMNAISQHGEGVAHIQGSGLMPHADEKFGCRFLYPGSGTVQNVMATNWREPQGPGSGNGARQETQLLGTWPAGSNQSVAFWLSNQSNVTIPGFGTGIRTGVYLSTNDIISTGDTRIYETTYGGNWGPGASGRYNPTVSVPETMPAGAYYVGVFFDNQNLIAESGTGATESDNTCVLGRITVSNSLRSLNISSVNPSAGVAIGVSLPDSAGLSNGATPFSRSYWGSSQRVTLTAPASVGRNNFRFWRLNSVQQGGGTTLAVTMNQSHTAEAVYWNNVAGDVVQYGPRGCAGTNGLVPNHFITHGNGAGGPQVGSPLTYNLSRARPSSSAALYIGVRTDRWGQFVLPLELSFIFMPGCFINHDILAVISASTSVFGTASFTDTYPADPSFVGGHLYTTWAVVDPGANRLGVVHSDSLDMTLGGDTP